MARNVLSATVFFRIPPEQVFEVGIEVRIWERPRIRRARAGYRSEQTQ